ncbi:MAG: hypothetical protein ACK4WH_13100 [Phycisphaerales bacterium]
MSTILIRTDIDQDPRALRIAEETRKPIAFVVGALVWLWSRAYTQSHGGALPNLTAQMIDRTTGIKGFAAALVLVKWLTINEDGVSIPDFEKYHGRSAKTRHQERVKKAMQRYGQRPDVVPHKRDETGTQPGHDRDTSGTTARHRIGSDRIGSYRIGSDPLTSDAARACDGPPADMPDDWRAGAAWLRDAAARDITAAYPRCKSPSGPKVVVAWLQHAGIADERWSGPWAEAHAALWLLGRVRTFAASRWVGTTHWQWVPNLASWLREGKHDLPDDTWAESNAEPAAAPARPGLSEEAVKRAMGISS